MPTEFELPLMPKQIELYDEINKRLQDARPTILWSGKQSGKTLISRKISQTFENMQQIGIGLWYESFDGFLIDTDDFVHAVELPMEHSNEFEFVWDRISPTTLVFIDDLFNLPFAEEIYNQVLTRTRHVVAMACSNSHAWAIANYTHHYLGPYATWELNPLLDQDTLRKSRPTGLDNKHKYNNDVLACVETNHWKTYK